MQPVQYSNLRSFGSAGAPHVESEAEAKSTQDHSQIHQPRAGVTGVVLQWEPVESIGDWRPDNSTVEQIAFYRAKVPGGWLVAMKGSYQANGMGLTFYPDPLNAWNEACSACS